MATDQKRADGTGGKRDVGCKAETGRLETPDVCKHRFPNRSNRSRNR